MNRSNTFIHADVLGVPSASLDVETTLAARPISVAEGSTLITRAVYIGHEDKK